MEPADSEQSAEGVETNHARSGLIVAPLLGAGLGAVLALHFLEPAMQSTWSYAHLSRDPARFWLGIALVVLLPAGAHVLAARPAAALPSSPLTWRVAAALLACLFGLFLLLGHVFPAPTTSTDSGLFLGWVSHGGEVARWHLLLKTYQLGVESFGSLAPPITIVRAINALMASIAVTSVFATARLIARTRGEARAMVALAVSSMGVLQLCLGYADVYPLPLAVMSAYIFCALSTVRGRLHPIWPLALAAVGPFFYVGLVLLVPSVVVVLVSAARQERGARRVAIGAAFAIALNGVATLPRFGALFAWRAFADAIEALPATHMGANPSGYSLPLGQVFSVARLEEVAHLLLLVDPVGWLLVFCVGIFATSLRRRPEGPTLAILGLLVAPYLAFVFAMEPLYGAYGDWDLFSYGAVATSLLGGYAFVLWGRAFPARFPLLLGLALACASVHLLARLNALDVDAERHMRESPSHLAHARALR